MTGSEEKQARRFVVSGRVQGVGYRYFVLQAAERLGLAGFVRNLRDQRVEVYAVGTAAELRSLLADLRQGPAHAKVETVDETEAELTPALRSGFSIAYDE